MIASLFLGCLAFLLVLGALLSTDHLSKAQVAAVASAAICAIACIVLALAATGLLIPVIEAVTR